MSNHIPKELFNLPCINPKCISLPICNSKEIIRCNQLRQYVDDTIKLEEEQKIYTVPIWNYINKHLPKFIHASYELQGYEEYI